MKKVSASLMLILGFLFHSNGQAVPRGLNSNIERELIDLQNSLDRAGETHQKFKVLNSSLLVLRELQNSTAETNVKRQTRLALILSALQSLPDEKSFKKDRCLSYEEEYLRQFDPLAEEEPSDPSVLYAWDALQRLCK